MKKIDSKKLFSKSWDFLLGAANIKQIPQYRNPEVAFVGASNVGKSSIINALLNRKIAVVSSTPGRTRQLNFFISDKTLPDSLVLVDMPGYGYAKASKNDIEAWQKTSFEFLARRANLKRVFLLIDPIKGLKESDLDIINMFNGLAVSFQIVLTKIDKLKESEVNEIKDEITLAAKKWPAFYSHIICTSSVRGTGIYELQDAITQVL
ncbi:MAG: ribosome biogenesis GTP-binding protein YihA/YsxC [Rickettsiales bacterium]|nr:ribosome biogenesis GTP-binding protein YihA/YsxC [Rickettsiales bacterium]